MKRVGMGGRGNFEDTTLEAASVQTKAEAEAVKAAGANYGAQVRDVNAENASLQAAAEQINGGAIKNKLATEEFQARAAAYNDEQDRLDIMTQAGMKLDPSAVKRQQAELNDLTIMAAGLGIDLSQ